MQQPSCLGHGAGYGRWAERRRASLVEPKPIPIWYRDNLAALLLSTAAVFIGGALIAILVRLLA